MNEITSRLNRHSVTSEFPSTVPLSWVASGIETSALWFLGRCLFRLKFARAPRPDAEGMILQTTPIPATTTETITTPLRWSNPISLSHLRSENSFPERLVHRWEDFDLSGEPTTVFTFAPTDLKMSLGLVAYALGDLTVDLFKRGATEVCAQYSEQDWQLRANLCMEEKSVRDFMDSRISDYSASECVYDLPWPVAAGK